MMPNSLIVGRFSSFKRSLTASAKAKSPEGHTSRRLRANIRYISAVHRPIPLIAISWPRTTSLSQTSNAFKFVSLEVNAGSLSKHQAKLTLIMDDKKYLNKSQGNGPVDATFNSIKNITKTDFHLKLYQVHAITAGTDAKGEVTVRLEDDDLSSQAKGSDPDIIVASAKAYVSALNRIIFKKTKSIVKNSAEIKIEGV